MRFARLATFVFVLLLASMPAFAAMRERPVEWSIGDERFGGVLVYDDANAARRPGLVLLPNWMGVSRDMVEMGKRVAGDDYVVLVADVFGRDIRPKDDKQALAAVKQAYADGGRTLRVRAQRAVDVLKSQRDEAPLDAAHVGALGFCFGGGVALELARAGSDVAGVVSFHGHLDSYVPAAGGIKASILALNGADDTSVDAAQVAKFEQEMKAARADWQLVHFGGARHCFSQPEDADQPADSNCRYDERAAKRAFGMMRDFFAERFARAGQ